ncbi:hypothetical protein B0T10DRAFT_136805 [Thelonectria olida]|uniref:BHLH domain-containing protein n=1 Tax=Thelonectria olida TaxID=1576542 RepID=A0A9P8VXB3_9HYPO|nr:hypothetical protein B0T10DRAFT_136805 [Thelonectria olida]
MVFRKAVSGDDSLPRPGFDLHSSTSSPAPSELSEDSCCQDFGNSSTSCSPGGITNPTLYHLIPFKCKSGKDEDHLEPLSVRRSGSHESKTTTRRAIDRDYPTKLSNEFSALRDSIPSLQGRTTKGQEENHPEHLQEPTVRESADRATILREAMLYISRLEERNETLQTEHMTLELRVAAYESLFRLCSS